MAGILTLIMSFNAAEKLSWWPQINWTKEGGVTTKDAQKSFGCAFCELEFESHAQLNAHIPSHLNDKVYNPRMRSPSPEKAFECPIVN